MTTEKLTATFDIAIGPDFTRSYWMYETNAPEDYDGFGTITVTKAGNERYVLVNVEHEQWQVQRYGSGNHKAQQVDVEGHEHFITEKLYKRLSGGAQ